MDVRQFIKYCVTEFITDLSQFYIWRFLYIQWRSQNAEKVTHTKGRLLYQAMILYNNVPF